MVRENQLLLVDYVNEIKHTRAISHLLAARDRLQARRFWLTLHTLILLSSADLPAGTIFSDFGPANSYDHNGGLLLSGGASGFPSDAEAMSFTALGNSTLTQIHTAISHISGTNSAMLTLYSDRGGLPGEVLTSQALTNLPVLGTCCTVETITLSSSVTLTSSTRYWIVVGVLDANTLDAWNFSTTGATGLVTSNIGGSGFSAALTHTLSAFDVQGDSVPEPSSIVLLLIGFAAFSSSSWLCRFKKRLRPYTPTVPRHRD